MRFLLPWSGHWSYGDLVFIVDPFLWLMLGGSAFLLTATTKARGAVWLMLAAATSFIVLFGPASRGGLPNPTPLRVFWICALVTILVLHIQGGTRSWGVGVSMTALVTICLYLIGLFVIHQFALRQTGLEASRIAGDNREQMIKTAAMPTLANPTRWISMLETDRATYRFNLDLLSGSTSSMVRFPKPEGPATIALARAKENYDAQVFLEFSRFPVINVAGSDCLTETLVQFADLRYTEPGRGSGTFSLEVPVDCPVLQERAQ
jgi:inner membrane protein